VCRLDKVKGPGLVLGCCSRRFDLGAYASRTTLGCFLILGLLLLAHLSPGSAEFFRDDRNWGAWCHSLDHVLAFSFDELHVAIEWALR
jgi:hypothetical protein